MKIPSLTKLYEESLETFKRFPLVILLSALGSFFMIYLIEIDAEPGRDSQQLYNVVMCCALGISFLLSLTLRNEVFKLEPLKNYLAQGVGVVFLIAYYFWLPKDLGVIDITRFLLFGLGFHFLVSFTAFMNKDAEHQQNIDAFWRFNKLFFLRILTAVLFSGVLYGGLCVAILSFNELFEMHINGRIYAQLFFLILGVFNTWFFLAGVPENLNSFYEEEVYPKSLKIFTQFVLLPLVTVYLVILYMYMGKIIILWNLPVGWVSYLILCFSIAGIFSLLLIYPIRNYEENRWIRVFSKSFYIALLPLIILLFVAILTRLFEYGITEKRYFVFVLACWLTFIALYFLISKTKNIKIIPITLCLLCFITSFGPWGAFAVSQRSQMNRLEKILTANKILVDGKIKPLEKSAYEKISDNDEGNVSSIVHYLAERNSISSLQKWFDSSLDTITGKKAYSQPGDVMNLMGLKYKPFYREDSNNNKEKKETFYYSFDEYKFLQIKEFDFLVKLSFNNKMEGSTINRDSSKFDLDIVKEGNSSQLKITLNNKDSVKIDFKELLTSLKKEEKYSRQSFEKGTLKAESNKLKIELHLSNIGGEYTKDSIDVNSLFGELFIKLR